MNRRKFLQLAAGAGVVASATMVEAGFFAEFMSWVKRQPVWSIPQKTSVEVLQYSDYASFTDLAVETAIDNKFVGIIHPFSVHDLLDDFQPNVLSHLSLQDLASVYYDKKAIDNLKANMPFAEACREIEASVIRTKNNRAENVKAFVASNLRKIDHYGEERLAYTRDENGVPRRVVYDATTNKLDFLPTSSLVFKT